VKSIGEVAPTLAGVYCLFPSMMGFNSKTGSSVKMNPTFPSMVFFNISKAGILFPNFFNYS